MEWYKYFQNLNNINFCSENHGVETGIVEDVETWAACQNSVLDEPITAEEVYNLSKKLK